MTDVDPNLAAHVAQLKPGQHVVAEWYGDDTSIGVVSENRINADADSYLVLSDRVLRHSDGSPPSDLARIIFPTYIPDPQPTPTGPTLPTEEEWNAEFGRLMPAQDRPGDFDRGWTAAQNWIQERTRGGVLIGPQSAEDVDRLAQVMRDHIGAPGAAPWGGLGKKVRDSWLQDARSVLAHLGIPTEQAPTQPDEPPNFGACVEVGGVRYLRGVGDRLPWLQEVEADWHEWSDLTDRGLVNVLSQGWSA